jgi:thioredoxin-related protein
MKALNVSITLFLLFALTCVKAAESDQSDPFEFSDQPITRHFKYPAWFKDSFLDLQQDLADAKQAGKLGIIVYFGQNNCAYCENLLEINWEKHTDIVDYTRKYFDVVPINIWGSLEVTLPNGETLTEKHYADKERTNFTPSLIFYNTEGKQIFRLRGYHLPYQFRAALDYVVSGYYQEQSFRDYLSRADSSQAFDEGELNFSELFAPPPYLLDRSQVSANQPLAVFFEQPSCHACDILHSDLLYHQALFQDLENMETVQLNMWADTPVITPQGEKTTARAWADKLELFFTPTIVFFDEQGQEVFRVESVVQEYRLGKVLKYVLSKGYLKYPHFQRWYTDKVLRQPES